MNTVIEVGYSKWSEGDWRPFYGCRATEDIVAPTRAHVVLPDGSMCTVSILALEQFGEPVQAVLKGQGFAVSIPVRWLPDGSTIHLS